MSTRAYELQKIQEYFTKKDATSKENAIKLDTEWNELKITIDKEKYPFIKEIDDNKFWLDVDEFQKAEKKFNKIIIIMGVSIGILLLCCILSYFLILSLLLV